MIHNSGPRVFFSIDQSCTPLDSGSCWKAMLKNFYIHKENERLLIRSESNIFSIDQSCTPLDSGCCWTAISNRDDRKDKRRRPGFRRRQPFFRMSIGRWWWFSGASELKKISCLPGARLEDSISVFFRVRTGRKFAFRKRIPGGNVPYILFFAILFSWLIWINS